MIVVVWVDAAGNAARAAVRHSSGFPLLDEAALQAVRNWQFVPARVDGIAIATAVEVPVNFALAR